MMSKCLIHLKLYFSQDKGATAIEYGLIAAAVALAISGAVYFFGDTTYNLLYSELPNALNR